MIMSLKEIKELNLEPFSCESGYFLMVDISKAIDKIPKKYLESHDFEYL